MENTTFRRLGASVTVRGDSHVMSWLLQSSNPYFEIENEATKTGLWTIVVGAEHGLNQTSSACRYPVDTLDADSYFIVSPAQRTVVVDIPRGQWRNLWALRMLRHLLRWQLFHQGAIFVSGSCLALGETGVLLVGPARSGKTTTLLQCLHSRQAALVGEDDVALVHSAADGFVALGWPGCIRVRRDVVGCFNELRDTARFTHPSNSSDSELLRLFPEEAKAVFGCRVMSTVPLRHIVRIQHIQRTNPAATHVMSKNAVQRQLQAMWDVLPERRPGMRPSYPTGIETDLLKYCYNPFLLEAFRLPDLGASFEQLRKYAYNLSGWEIAISPATDAADALVRCIAR